MCDDEAKKKIQKAISKCGSVQQEDDSSSFLPYGLHYIDNGNYHYVSSIYLSQLKEPFSLIVLDHHPDMQRPMFDILSCGGWIVDVLNNNEFVRDVHVIGADRGLIDELPDADKAKVRFYDIEDVFGKEPDGSIKVSLPDSSFPIYLSIDKDVIKKDELVTNWDQGEAEAEQVLELVRTLKTESIGACSGLNEGNLRLLGIDICGECATDQEGVDLGQAIAGNDVFNKKILEILKDG